MMQPQKTSNKFLKYHGMPAQKFLKALSSDFPQFSISPPIDVQLITDLLDVHIDKRVDFNNVDTVGSISIKDDRVVIWINPLENEFEPRERFTIAHEIGHLILHINPTTGKQEFIDTEKTIRRRDSSWDFEEYQANNFAAQLLMPADLIDKYGNIIIYNYKKETGESKIQLTELIKELASRFKVSELAMTYRLKNVGAIR
uniref:IrrE N-terminal-like domain-containing protein n=2 Tax=Candidatus Kentrum sp. TC TaxID=2126339 RepID=A0A450ZA46_9GAMM|nr:MAG: protein of unknown function (DUF955) [Candidatus Kentron sp. TC]